MKHREKSIYLLFILLIIIGFLIFKPKVEDYRIKKEIESYIDNNENEIEKIASDTIHNEAINTIDEFDINQVSDVLGLVDFRYHKYNKPDSLYGFYYTGGQDAKEAQKFIETKSEDLIPANLLDEQKYGIKIRKIKDNIYYYNISK